ncbi:hypothetical protein HWV62_29116 [Athelia sp. TMB]|nr:hypothetical protein HWV62_29116 [Athelia sp. TMB]
MSRQGRRLNRLPQRLDYTLIPAPLDLSLPQAGEKSSIPAIIVTPSSPTCDFEFYIAFSPKPTLRDRLAHLPAALSAVTLRARTALVVGLLFFVVLCHLFTHQLGISRPHLRFDAQLQAAAPGAEQAQWGAGWLKMAGLGGRAEAREAFVVDARDLPI